MNGRILTNKEKALNNILKKKSLLESWHESGLPKTGGRDGGGCDFEYYPKTIRQFHAWDLSQNSESLQAEVGSLKRNANDTLNKYPDIRMEIQRLIVGIIVKQKISKPGVGRVAELRRELADARNYSSMLERELVFLRIERGEMQAKINALSSGKVSLEEEAKEAIGDLEKQISELKRGNAELISQIKKIIPIRGA